LAPGRDAERLEVLDRRIDEAEARARRVLRGHAPGLPAEAIVGADDGLERLALRRLARALLLARLRDAVVREDEQLGRAAIARVAVDEGLHRGDRAAPVARLEGHLRAA